MEYIKNIEIKNFKSIRHQVIEGCKRINVFIGYPNVGKSNLLEALSLYCITPNIKFTDLIRVKETPTLFFNGFINDPIEVTLNGVFKLECAYIKGELKVVEKYIEATENGRYPTLKENWFRDFEFNRAIDPQTIMPRIGIEKYEFKKTSSKYVGQYSYLNAPFGENIFGIIQTNEKLYQEAIDLLKEYKLEFLYDSGQQAFTIFKRTNKGIFTVPYELLADTIQRLIFYKAAIFSNKEKVLLFEEPEAHMFPPYISKFTSDIWYNKDNQYFITSHSPFVVNDFLENAKDELAVFVLEYKNDETVIKRLSDEQLTEAYQYGIDLFFNLERLAE